MPILVKCSKRLVYLFILISLTCHNAVFAGSFEVVFAPTEIYYQDQSSATWEKATCGTILSERSNIKLPNFSYLMLLHSSGKIYSEDTVGIISIQALEKLIEQQITQHFSATLLKNALLNPDFKKKKSLFYFCEEQTSSRCCGSFFVFGGEQKSFVRNNNSSLRWVNTDKTKNSSFRVLINNLYDEELLSKPLSEHEFIPIPSKLIGKLKQDEFINVRLISGKTEVSTSLRLMSREKELSLKKDLELLKKEYPSENTLQYLICRYLIERNHQVLLECSETYYSIFYTIQSSYGVYNSDYFNFFYQASTTQTGKVISIEGTKLLLKSTSGNFNIPKGTTITISNTTSGFQNSVGTGIMEEETPGGATIKLTSIYSSLLLSNGKTNAAIRGGDVVEISWFK